MNRDVRFQTPTYPTLSGEVWDNAAGFDEPTTSAVDKNVRVICADPVTATSQPLIFTSREKD
jgi:hypothetical protein